MRPRAAAATALAAITLWLAHACPALAQDLSGYGPTAAPEPSPPPAVGAPATAPRPATTTASDRTPATAGRSSATTATRDGPSPPSVTSAAADRTRTPLAGDRYEADLFGEHIVVPPRDPDNVTAFQIGATFYSPPIGKTAFLPFGALYLRRQTDDDWRRFRMTFTGLVNDVELADGTWNDYGFEALARWENDTVPLPRGMIDRGHSRQFTEMIWGYVRGGIGLGWRTPVPPSHFDNDFRVQLFYEPGFFFAQRSWRTAQQTIIPDDTFEHQLHFRLRYDCYDRNLLELLHEGWGAGLDVVGGRRDVWSDFGLPSGAIFRRDETRDYLRVQVYANAAFGVPFLSERHRLVATGAVGWAPNGNLDRHSAFRIGGGPPISETFDLYRNPFPGAVFDQLLSERYALASIEYRYEVLFFLFLHLRGTAAWARLFGIDGLPPDVTLIHREEMEQAFSVGLSSGFLWNSMIYLEYSYNTGGVIRDQPGSGVLVSWTFSF